MSAIAERLESVRARIATAARSAGRDPSDVVLVAVSKLHPASAVREAYACGQRAFGENYVQELVTKAGALGDCDGIVWHAIGHVQTNKAREVARVAHVVESVDSPRLVTELGRRARDAGRVLDVLVQVNVGGEAQKSGCDARDVGAVLDAIANGSGLRVRGLMTVPPETSDPSDARPFFERLVALREVHGGARLLPVLSIGMTHDLDVAIACGATEVRVGTAIFGARTG